MSSDLLSASHQCILNVASSEMSFKTFTPQTATGLISPLLILPLYSSFLLVPTAPSDSKYWFAVLTSISHARTHTHTQHPVSWLFHFISSLPNWKTFMTTGSLLISHSLFYFQNSVFHKCSINICWKKRMEKGKEGSCLLYTSDAADDWLVV